MMDFEQEDLDGDSDDSDALQRVIPMEEMESVLAYAYEHSRLAGLFAWALNCGMRQGECLGLKSSLADPAAGALYQDRGQLFSDEYGDFLRPWKALKEFQDILEALGLKKHRFHDLRHTFVSLLVKESRKNGKGISILDV